MPPEREVTSTRTDHRTTPPPARRPIPERSGIGWAVAITAVAVAALLIPGLVLSTDAIPARLGTSGALTLVVFAAAVAGWISNCADDTFVALVAAVALVIAGTLPAEKLFAALGAEQIWLLLAAFVLAAAISRTPLPARAAVRLLAGARGLRSAAHRTTAAVLLTALLVPSTGGRAALLVPVHRALAETLPGAAPDADPRRPARMLALLLPTTVLLSAAATLTGAGAHLITNAVLESAGYPAIGFGWWLLLGVPFAAVSSHLAAELVLLLFSRRTDRGAELRIDPDYLREQLAVPTGLQPAERRVLALLAGVVAMWCTEELHGLSPALTALVGALLVTAPRIGALELDTAVSAVPWSMLLFTAATASLGSALSESGAATWLAAAVLDGGGGPVPVLLTVVVLSAAAHLLVQSRSARSAVLIPLLIPAAVTAGADPVALAFASTAAAGFCHTTTSSAKPLAVFSRLSGVPTFGPRDLLLLSAPLGPLVAVLVAVFALAVWPLLGLPLD